MQGNSLKKIIEKYPGVWKESKRFKALLLDYYPEDKITRNLILICNDEGIPGDLEKEKYINNQRVAAFSKRLISACGCTVEKAQEITNIWIEALNVIVLDDVDNSEIDLSMGIDELELSVRAYNTIKRAGVSTIGELVNLRHSIYSIRGMGRKTFTELAEKLDNIGYDSIQFSRADEFDENPLKQLSSVIQYGAHKSLLSEFEKSSNHRMTITTLEKAVFDGFKGDYSPIILAYVLGEYGVRKDTDKAGFYAKKWYELYKNKELTDYPSVSNCILVFYFLAGYTVTDISVEEDKRSEEIKTIISEAVKLSSLLDEDSGSRIDAVLTAIGLGLASGELECLFNEVRYSIGKDLSKAIQALTIASSRGNQSATKCLIMAYLDSELEGNTYNSLRESYMTLLSQDMDETYSYMDELLKGIIWTDEEKPDLVTLKIGIDTKKKLYDKNLHSIDDLLNSGVKSFKEANEFTDDNLVDLMVGIGRFIKE